MSVLDRIVAQRRGRIGKQGHALGASLPAARTLPQVPFGADPFLVCEVNSCERDAGPIALPVAFRSPPLRRWRWLESPRSIRG